MRRMFLAVALCVALIAVSTSPHARAKGNGVTITPDSGAAGADVQLSSDFWRPHVQVQVFVGSSTSYAEPSSYAGPVATVNADADGHWSVAMRVDDVSGFTLPQVPSFVVYKAVSAGAGAAPGATEALAYFALTVDGRRPDGAGGVRLTIEGRPATAWLDWEPAGSDTFYISHVGPFGPPLRDYSLGHLTNGDWDIVVPSTLVPVAATGGSVIIVQATLCASASIPCDPRPGPLTVVRVPVRDGEVTAATIMLGEPTRPTAAPATGYGAAAASHWRTDIVVGVLFVAGVFVLLSAAAVGARRRTR